MMSSICSSWTGQTSMQAPQVVQPHTASGEMANSSSGRAVAAPVSKAEVWSVNGLACPEIMFSSMRLLISSAAGLSALPVAEAGHTSWQRLHWIQA